MKLNPKYERMERLREKLKKSCDKLTPLTVSEFLWYKRAYIYQIINNNCEWSSHFRDIVEYKLTWDYEKLLLYKNIVDIVKKYTDKYWIDDIIYDLPERIKNSS